MTNNSFVVLKGIPTPIILPFSDATSIKEVYDDAGVRSDHRFSLKNKSFSKSDIKYIEVVPDGSSGETWNKKIRDDNVNAWKIRKAFLARNPESKAKELDMFFYLYKFATGQDPSQDDMDKAYAVQIDFYTNNPNRMICDANLLMALVPDGFRKGHAQQVIGRSMNKSGAVQIPVIAEGAYFRFVENAILTDMRLSKKSYGEE